MDTREIGAKNQRILHTILLTLLLFSVFGLGIGVGYFWPKNDAQILPLASKKEVKVSLTPTTTVTVSPTPTDSVTPVPNLKTYKDSDTKLQFSYPSNYQVVPGAFTQPKYTSEGQEEVYAYKKIEIIKDSTTRLILEMKTEPTDCVGGGNEGGESIDVVFFNTAANEYMGRKINTLRGGDTYVVYGRYSSPINRKGFLCDFFYFAPSESSKGKFGYFNARIESANLKQDFSDFDNIIKSAKRI